jgi:hypothetical protein
MGRLFNTMTARTQLLSERCQGLLRLQALTVRLMSCIQTSQFPGKWSMKNIRLALLDAANILFVLVPTNLLHSKQIWSTVQCSDQHPRMFFPRAITLHQIKRNKLSRPNAATIVRFRRPSDMVPNRWEELDLLAVDLRILPIKPLCILSEVYYLFSLCF